MACCGGSRSATLRAYLHMLERPWPCMKQAWNAGMYDSRRSCPLTTALKASRGIEPGVPPSTESAIDRHDSVAVGAEA